MDDKERDEAIKLYNQVMSLSSDAACSVFIALGTKLAEQNAEIFANIIAQTVLEGLESEAKGTDSQYIGFSTMFVSVGDAIARRLQIDEWIELEEEEASLLGWTPNTNEEN